MNSVIENYITDHLGHLPNLQLTDEEILKLQNLIIEEKKKFAEKEIQIKLYKLIADDIDQKTDRARQILDSINVDATVSSDLIRILDLCQIEVNPLKKKQLEIKKALLCALRDWKNNEKQLLEAEQFGAKQHSGRSYLTKVQQNMIKIIEEHQETIKKVHCVKQKESKQVEKLQIPSVESVEIVSTPSEIKFGNLFALHIEVKEQIQTLERMTTDEPLIGDIPVSTEAQLNQHLNKLQEEHDKLNLEYTEVVSEDYKVELNS